VEGEEPEEETEGFTLLKYMERKGVNQFVWGKVSDRLKTLYTDILLKVEPPIPVSSRLWGLPKDVVKEVEKLFRVLWSIIFHKPKYILQGFFTRIMIFKGGGGGEGGGWHLRALKVTLYVPFLTIFLIKKLALDVYNVRIFFKTSKQSEKRR
jgi:hypothetical protein